MSKAIDIANAMAARINAISGIPSNLAVVDRQKDIRVEVAHRVLKGTGSAIIILYEGFSNPAPMASGLLNITRRYSVTLYARPILQDAEVVAADELIELVARELHNWEPDEASAGFGEIIVTGCDLRPDKSYFIYDLDLEVLSRL